MCTVCGCGEGETQIEGHHHHHGHSHDHTHEHPQDHGHGHHHAHGADHGHSHHHHAHTPDAQGDLHFGQGPAHAHVPGMSQERMVQIEQNILGKNDQYAAANRKWLADRGVFAINLVSSPGSGKTTLLTETIKQLQAEVAVIEGDQQTANDADRIRATGAKAVQINTGKGCHLDAHMVGHAAQGMALAARSVLMIENVGNLVCPAAFDLGEAHKVAILSVTEGEDKPLKYPDMFHAADLMILNKVDLLPHLNFDVEQCIEYARRVKPDIQVLQLSATTGEGMQAWLEWIEQGRANAAAQLDDSLDALRRRNHELEHEVADLKARLAARGDAA